MEKSSTDKRIDEPDDRVGRFERNVDRRFEKVDRQFERFEDKVDARFARVDEQFGKLATKEQLENHEVATKEGMAKLDARLGRWDKIVTGGVVSIAGAVVYKVLGL